MGFRFMCEMDLPVSRPMPLNRRPSAGAHSFLRHSVVQTSLHGTGLAACCPLVSPFGLPLGPALPWEDQPSPGTLGLSVSMILAYFALLMPTFSLLFNSQSLTVLLSLKYNAPLPIALLRPQASVICLAPGIFGATILDQ